MILSSRISTKTRVRLLLGLVSVVFVGLNMAALGGLVFPAFAEFERQDAIRDIGRLSQAIRREQQFLADFSGDWAHWDDTWAFVDDFDPEYFASNLTVEATSATPTDLIVIVDRERRMQHFGTYHRLVKHDAAVRQRLAPGSRWFELLVEPLLRDDAAADDTIDRLLLLDGLPLMVSAQPILRSDLGGPARGVLIMASLFDVPRQRQVEQRTLQPFLLRHHAGGHEGSDALQRFETGDGDPGSLVALDRDRLRLTVDLPAADGGVFRISSDFERHMTRQGGLALLLALGISTLSFMLLVVGLYFRLLRRSFLQPLRAIVAELDRVEDDRDLSARLPVQGAAELQKLALSFNGMMVELEAQRDEIALLSMTDPLTRLPNRRQFEQVAAREWQRAQRQQSPISLLMCDIDYFKAYNDHYGHPAGDDCLRRVAQGLLHALKRRTDLAARYGGEEFVLVLPETDLDGGIVAAHRVLSAVRRLQLPHARSPVAPHVTISIGVRAGTPQAGDRLDDWLADADSALYRAKAGGRDRAMAAVAEDAPAR